MSDRQPEERTEERTETHACDLISRQAAIDAVKEEWDGWSFEYDAETIVSYTCEALERLPSAQPEPTKINIEDFNKEDWERLKKEWENTPITVLSAQPERKKGRWIDETFKPWGLVHHPYKCDQCGEHSETNSNHCPNCGADMRGEKDG